MASSFYSFRVAGSGVAGQGKESELKWDWINMPEDYEYACVGDQRLIVIRGDYIMVMDRSEELFDSQDNSVIHTIELQWRFPQ